MGPDRDLIGTHPGLALGLSKNKIVSSRDSSFATLSEYFFSCLPTEEEGSSPCFFFFFFLIFFFVSFLFFYFVLLLFFIIVLSET
jgi:hypothetical protein